MSQRSATTDARRCCRWPRRCCRWCRRRCCWCWCWCSTRIGLRMFVRWIWAIPSGRAFRSNLRCAPISAAIPIASVRFAHCALRLPSRLTGRAEVPDTVPGIRRPVLAPALRAALAASRSASASRAGARVGALPASPVRASPVTGLRTAAGATADASGSALRATARGPGRSARHSSAVAAPLRRLRRRRFPHRSGRSICRSLPPGAAFFSHPTHR